MITAKEYLKKLDQESGTTWTEDDESICKAFVEFAKLHVQAALKAADEKAMVTVVDYEFELEPPTPIWGVDSDSILNAYPLDKIK